MRVATTHRSSRSGPDRRDLRQHCAASRSRPTGCPPCGVHARHDAAAPKPLMLPGQHRCSVRSSSTETRRSPGIGHVPSRCASTTTAGSSPIAAGSGPEFMAKDRADSLVNESAGTVPGHDLAAGHPDCALPVLPWPQALSREQTRSAPAGSRRSHRCTLGRTPPRTGTMFTGSLLWRRHGTAADRTGPATPGRRRPGMAVAGCVDHGAPASTDAVRRPGEADMTVLRDRPVRAM
jgi:hypothetical protein